MKRILARIQRQEYGAVPVSDPELFELPGEQPAATLVANLVRALKLPTQNPSQPAGVQYWLSLSNGDIIADSQTLTDAGVRNHSLLTLQSGTDKHAPNPTRVSAYATLRTMSGEIFDLKPRSLIGRADSQLKPEVDMSAQQDAMTVSRQHAYIEVIGATWFLTALPTKNSTSLKGKAVSLNTRHPLNDGDEIIFGKVKTIFKLGHS